MGAVGGTLQGIREVLLRVTPRSIRPKNFKFQSVLSFILWADILTFQEFRRLKDTGLVPDSLEKTLEFRVKPLHNRPIRIRPGTSDVQVLWNTFGGRYHLPPPQLMRWDLRCIWDLGSNIGLTMAHFATLFPRARVLGVEMDSDNAALCRENIRPWADRCELVEAAAWINDGSVTYESVDGAQIGSKIVLDNQEAPDIRTAHAVSLNSLLSRISSQRIDYMKVDVEGAERQILQEKTEWADRVRCIKVEVHEPYTIETCLRDLQRLGFSTSTDVPAHAVIGVRSPT